MRYAQNKQIFKYNFDSWQDSLVNMQENKLKVHKNQKIILMVSRCHCQGDYENIPPGLFMKSSQLLKSLFSLDKNTKSKEAQKHRHAKRSRVFLCEFKANRPAEGCSEKNSAVLSSADLWKVCYQSLVSSNPFIGSQIGLSIVSQIQRFLWSADRMVADGRWQNANAKCGRRIDERENVGGKMWNFDNVQMK